ncbi:MAG: galactokinase [Bacteroidetes bacterium]|nr:MAG: galactokinase [Bacteroidota bacterium]
MYREHFSSECILVFAPGRINLIGEHTDYNEGFVLPAAIHQGLYFAVGKSEEADCQIVSRDKGEQVRFSPGQPLAAGTPSWANYFIGVSTLLRRRGHPIPAFNCVFGGDLPAGAGLSSSAALSAGFGLALNELLGLGISRLELAKIAQETEHEFAGVNCGIMDPFAILHGKAGHAIRLDCRSLEFEYIPFQTEAYKLLLCDTRIKHELASTEYNSRRKEVEAGIKRLQIHSPSLHSMRDVNKAMLQEEREGFHPSIYKRCLFVLEENDRVDATCAALKAGDFARMGELLYLSHEGLQFDYEVSCRELDFLVSQARKDSHIAGARMMGGGFGGATINLVATDAVGLVSDKMKEAYSQAFGFEPEIFEVQIGEGARVI